MNAWAIDPPTGVRGTEINHNGDPAIQWSWDSVPGAIQYELTIDGSVVGLTPNSSYLSEKMWAGDHSLSVKSVDQGWRYSYQSETAKVYVTGSAAASSSAQQRGNSSFGPPSSVTGIEVAQSTVRWEWSSVANAVQYQLVLDGQVLGLVSGTTHTTGDLWAGDHSMTVKAVSASGQYSAASVTAKIVVRSHYDASSANQSSTAGGQDQSSGTASSGSNDSGSSGSAGIPQNPRGIEVAQGLVKWEWDWVPGAARYELTVDGKVAGTTPDTNYHSSNLWAGDHSLTVRSVSSDGSLSARSATAKINVSANFNSGSAARSYLVGEEEPSGNSGSGTQAAPPRNNPDDNGLIDPASWAVNEVYQKPGYELVFSDEFNSASINPARWHTQLRWDGDFNGERYEYRIINGEEQFYVNLLSQDQGHRDTVVPAHNPFELNGSRLAIRAIRNPLKRWDGNADHGSLFDVVSQQNFLSGALSTYDHFKQKYGLFEIRAKIPSHVGTFPAIWLHHQRREWENTRKTEIDIMENLGHAPWYIYNSFHYHLNVSTSYGGDAHFVKPYPDGQVHTGTDYSQDFHTYAVKWEPGYIAWSIDGEVVSELWNDNVNYEELYLIINLAIGGHWTNYPSNSGGLGRSSGQEFPTANDINNWQNPAFEIDWVRVYRPK